MFPDTSGRRFSLNWTVDRPWLRYSLLNDRAYCLPCLCFAETESPFASTGFNKWKKALGLKSSLLEKHNASEVHKLAEEKACLFLKNQQRPGLDVASMMAREGRIQQIRTKKGILSIIDVVIALGKRGIAFRGNCDKITKTEDAFFCELEIPV